MNDKQNRLQKAIEETRIRMIAGAFEMFGWRLTQTADYLGIPPSTLQSIIKRNPKLERTYKKHGHGRGRPFGVRKSP